jgi:hypothetical protein
VSSQVDIDKFVSDINALFGVAFSVSDEGADAKATRVADGWEVTAHFALGDYLVAEITAPQRRMPSTGPRELWIHTPDVRTWTKSVKKEAEGTRNRGISASVALPAGCAPELVDAGFTGKMLTVRIPDAASVPAHGGRTR